MIPPIIIKNIIKEKIWLSIKILKLNDLIINIINKEIIKNKGWVFFLFDEIEFKNIILILLINKK